MPSSLPAETEFAPAARLERPLLEEQYTELVDEGRITEVLDASPYIAMVTNTTRQIVYANSQLRRMLGMDGSSVMGRRPGELLSCPNSSLNSGGCGTSANCRFCGVVHVLLEAMGSDCRV